MTPDDEFVASRQCFVDTTPDVVDAERVDEHRRTTGDFLGGGSLAGEIGGVLSSREAATGAAQSSREIENPNPLLFFDFSLGMPVLPTV